jgi:hypothetical protein
MRTRIASILVVPAAAAALALAGCSVVDNAVQGAVDGVQEQAEQLADDAVRDALGGAGISRDGELPPGFPAEVPVVDGEVLGGGSAPNGGGWVAQYALADIAQFEEAADRLEEAGYASSTRNADETSGFGTFSDDAYTIVLTAASEPGEPTLTYVVTPSAGSGSGDSGSGDAG